MPEYTGPGGEESGSSFQFKASAAETSSTTHAETNSGGGSLFLDVAVTAASGTTPTMTIVVEGSQDGGTTWVTLGTVGANGYQAGNVGTAPSNFTTVAETKACLPTLQLVRTRSVMGGTTPSFTYSVNAVLR